MTNALPHGSHGIPPGSAASDGPHSMPRRSSYASVVAGSSSSASMNVYNRSLTLATQTGNPIRHPMGQPLMSTDSDTPDDGGGESAPTMWLNPGDLPSYSRQFRFLAADDHPGPDPDGGGTDRFFTPSYLRDSIYVERLAEAHRVKQSLLRDGPLSRSSTGNSPSGSSSSANLPKMALSHRGMTYDIIEKEPPAELDGLTPLPSRWNEADKYSGLDIQPNGLGVRFVGPGKSHEHPEAAAVRANHPMPPQCGIFYYEVRIVSKGKEGTIGIGFSGSRVSLNRLPGWEPESWAYHGDDGRSVCCSNSGRDYGPKFAAGDVIGCGVNFRTGCAFFTKNGQNLGIAFRDVKGKLYPSVGLKRPGEHVRANFGQRRFIFDIDGMMAKERSIVQAEIRAMSVASLSSIPDETALVQALVAQYLAHEGYVEAARNYARETHAEAQNLMIKKEAGEATGHEIEEDPDAINRQRIRMAILEGDIDKAFKHMNAYYPTVLKNNEHIYFRLRCRKFIEMIRQCSELQQMAQSMSEKQTESMDGQSQSEDEDEDDYDHDMELDEQVNNGVGWETMETEEVDAGLKHSDLLQETIKYGQVLQSEFRNDHRKEVKKALEDTFSLLAYEDPKTSVVAHLLEPSERVPVAEELNSAILVSLGQSSTSVLERLYQQTEVLIEAISEEGGAGAFINIHHDYMR